MRAVTLGDVAAAARTLMAVAEPERAALIRQLLDEAACADRYRRWWGQEHPRLGNGTLMARAMARPQADVAGPGDPAYLAALAQVIEAALDWRCGDASG
ncbi:MAG: hypothetical protein JJU15_15655 [Pararhodobacter sp.]|nr:hypothetical protein [Pararhodobacter sp.]